MLVYLAVFNVPKILFLLAVDAQCECVSLGLTVSLLHYLSISSSIYTIATVYHCLSTTLSLYITVSLDGQQVVFVRTEEQMAAAAL